MEYSIGDFSRITRLSIKTIRYYHETGLLLPTRIDNDNSYRFYSEKLLDRVRIIKKLKNMDLSIEQIKEALENYTDDTDIAVFLETKLIEVKNKIDNYKRVQREIESIIKFKNQIKMNNLNHDVQIKQIDEILIASIRFKGIYSDVGSYFGKIFRIAGRNVSGAPFSMYYDEGFVEEHADIEVCVPLKKEIMKEGIECKTLPGGKAYTIIHKGSYDTLGESYKKLTDKINNDGVKMKTPSREIYIKGPGMIFKGNPNNYLTELQIFVEE
jgi:DNA-binding transcriptional MerR regulator/DNA gyrase inhibitor GyrI